jgi:uncharacterized protein YbjQ (UPF0145 family)
MGNPLYGSNNQDALIDALANAEDAINDSLSTEAAKLGTDAVVADACIPITINGVDYVIALYAAAKAVDDPA